MASSAKSSAKNEPPLSPPTNQTAAERPVARRLLIAAGGVIGTAVVAALAAAIITPERLDAFFAPASSPSGAPEVVYKRVVSSDGVFTFDIPDTWLSGESDYNVTYGGVADQGSAMTAGEDPTDGRQPTEDGIYLGVSIQAAERLGLASAGRDEMQEWLDDTAADADWSRDDCVRGPSDLSGPDGWVTGIVAWDDCYGTKGLRLWEIYAVPPGGDFVLCVQPQLSARTDEAVIAHIIASLVIDDSPLHPIGGESVLP